MANTIPDGIYYPENTTDMELDTILATMASSIQNGIGKRVAKLETFVGCNLGLATPFVPTLGTATKVSTYAVQPASEVPGSFNQGMTVTNGTVTVPEDGLYSVMFTANFQPTVGSGSARINSYIFVNGVQFNFSSAYGASGATNRYTNCNVVAIYNLKKNDQIDVRVNILDVGAQLVSGTGSSFCVSLVSRTLS